MRILVIALLKPSQIKYKIIPLANSIYVDEIFIIRKYTGPVINKVNYIELPSICRFKILNLILSPFIILFQIKKIKPDLLLSYHFIPHGFFAWFTSLLTGVPFVYSQIDLDIQNIVQNPLFKRPVVGIIKKALFINVPGSKSKQFWLDKGIKPEKINVLHSTIDTTTDYYPAELEKLYDFIYVGVLEERKGIHLLLEAVSLLKQKAYYPTLVLVGEGDRRQFLENLSENLGISSQVKFIGHSTNVFQIINQCRYFILTSNNEGIPCAMMEAMACGLVPVSTDVADVADIVKNGVSGFLIDDFKPESICKSMISVLESNTNYAVLSTNARQIIIDEHSYTSATQIWNQLLQRF